MIKRLLPAATIVVVVLGGLTRIGVAQSGSASSPVVGAWRVSEIASTGPNAQTIKNPQPGLVIYTPRHYSIDMVTADAPRPAVPTQGATDKQRADAFGPFTANAGTYAIKGDELTHTIVTAKNPATMSSGSFQVYTFRMEGKNTLWLTTKANQTGPVANPTTLKLTRVE
jgi:Lipocalin-like domain